MAPAQPLRPDKEKRLKHILCKFHYSSGLCRPQLTVDVAFAIDLEAHLPTAVSLPSQGVLNDLQKHILEFPSKFGASAASKFEEIDGQGTSLWNLCTRLRRSFNSDNPQDIPVILLLSRTFAFLLLDGALEASKSTTENTLRLMKIGIKATKNCIGECLQRRSARSY